MENDDTPCDICRATNSEPCNEMVFCEHCDVCVHQACYGITKIPSGDWLCKKCVEGSTAKCIFCPSTKGAMKKTRNGYWAHVSCALWIPEVSFGEPDTMDDIINVEAIPKSRWGLNCSLCHSKSGYLNSACIQCYVKRCKTAFHVTCAFEHKLYVKMEDVETSDHDVKFESFCLEHTKMYNDGLDPHKDVTTHKKRKKNPESPTGQATSAEVLESTNIVKQITQSNGTPTVNKLAIKKETNAKNKNEIQNNEVNNASPESPTEQNNVNVFNSPCVSFTEPALLENGSPSKTVEMGKKYVPGMLSEQTLPKPLKATARKSFSIAQKKKSLTEILPKIIAKPNESLTPTPNGPSNPKKPRKSAPAKNPSLSPKKQKPKPVKKASPNKMSRSSIYTLFPSPQRPGSSSKANQMTKKASSFASPNEQNQASSFASPNEQNQASSFASPNEQNQASSFASPNEQNQASSFASPNEQNQASSSVTHNDQGVVSYQSPQVSSAMPQNNLDDFLRYLGSLIRPLSDKRAINIQKKIMTLVYREHQLSSDESDVSSVSSLD